MNYGRIAQGTNYDAIPAVRATLLKEMLRSPAHYKAALTESRVATPALIKGERIHRAILEPHRLDEFVVSPKFDRRTKDGKAAFELFAAANVGKTVLDADEYDQLVGIVNAVSQHPIAGQELIGCETEVGFVMRDEELGMDLKCRADALRLSDGVLIDVKSTSDASFKGFQRSIANFKYHVQLSFYADIIQAVTGTRIDAVRIIAVETESPFAVAVYDLDEGTLEKGRELYRFALHTLAECQKADHWPSYPETITPINLPAWAFNEGEL